MLKLMSFILSTNVMRLGDNNYHCPLDVLNYAVQV